MSAEIHARKPDAPISTISLWPRRVTPPCASRCAPQKARAAARPPASTSAAGRFSRWMSLMPQAPITFFGADDFQQVACLHAAGDITIIRQEHIAARARYCQGHGAFIAVTTISWRRRRWQNSFVALSLAQELCCRQRARLPLRWRTTYYATTMYCWCFLAFSSVLSGKPSLRRSPHYRIRAHAFYFGLSCCCVSTMMLRDKRLILRA